MHVRHPRRQHRAIPVSVAVSVAVHGGADKSDPTQHVPQRHEKRRSFRCLAGVFLFLCVIFVFLVRTTLVGKIRVVEPRHKRQHWLGKRGYDVRPVLCHLVRNDGQQILLVRDFRHPYFRKTISQRGREFLFAKITARVHRRKDSKVRMGHYFLHDVSPLFRQRQGSSRFQHTVQSKKKR